MPPGITSPGHFHLLIHRIADTINGYRINRNLAQLRRARIIRNDSVGAGMTRSAFLQRL